MINTLNIFSNFNTFLIMAIMLQMDVFRGNLFLSEAGTTPHVLVNNYRPAQALNGRMIYSSFKPYDPNLAHPLTSSFLSIVLGVVLNHLV
jgi:hypothetical protein